MNRCKQPSEEQYCLFLSVHESGLLELLSQTVIIA